MRFGLFLLTAPLALLAACGEPQTSQADNGAANVSTASSPAPAANAMPMLAAGPVSGADAKRVMHDRHEGMEAVGKATKAISRELKAGSPDLATVRTNAGKLANLSRQASGWFPAGTGPEVGKTGAKAEIWQAQNKADFAAKMASFQKAAQAFNASARGNDVNAIKASWAEVGKSCKGCHDKYRAEMKH